MEDFEKKLKPIRTFARSHKYPVMRPKTCAKLTEIVQLIDKNIKKETINVLEIGTCIGVSGLTMLNASPKVHLTTIELNESTYNIAKTNFNEFGFQNRVNQILGDCLEVVSYMYDNKYDLVILDGPKSKYEELTKMIIPMLNTNGYIFADDILYHGMVFSEYNEHKQRTIVTALRHFLTFFAEQSSFKVETINVEDGIL
ncbi:MAG: class I SAM-dependent methyltransferase, partial [Clostridia bacterium]|nr:class I SAM-dependent methyltransferase [Clostridia bacterium]